VPSDPGARPLLVILGPTAVGKSDLALLACERCDGEIVSVDSMQVYRGLDAATGKPDARARSRVPHHGIDLADPRRDFSLGDFVRAATATVEAIRSRGRLAVLVGGTGLYLRGLLRGIAEAPRRDAALRERLDGIGAARGVQFLHRMLRRVDPGAAARLPPRDRQRLVRALEVFFAGRRPLSELIGAAPFGPERWPAVKIGLDVPRERLGRLIDERVGRFFAAGLVDEVRGLLRAGVPESANAFKALGYRETLRHLRGGLTLEQAVAATRRATRRYAKRQQTWFRKEAGVTWFEIDPDREDRFAAPLEFAARALAARTSGDPTPGAQTPGAQTPGEQTSGERTPGKR
jgi:tRNA dimethylallyltransferase